MIQRIYQEQKGVTALETAIILIAFVVVAAVFAKSILSAGLFASERSGEAVSSGLQGVMNTLELRGAVIGYKDTLNSADNGSLGRVDITVTQYSDSGQTDLTPAYTLDSGTGALVNSNPNANRLQIAFIDQNVTIADCAWTVSMEGQDNGDHILNSSEKAVISVWLHTFDGTNWGPPGSETSQFLGTHYVDTYHTFSLDVKSASGAALHIERTTPAYLDHVTDLR